MCLCLRGGEEGERVGVHVSRYRKGGKHTHWNVKRLLSLDGEESGDIFASFFVLLYSIWIFSPKYIQFLQKVVKKFEIIHHKATYTAPFAQHIIFMNGIMLHKNPHKICNIWIETNRINVYKKAKPVYGRWKTFSNKNRWIAPLPLESYLYVKVPQTQ